MKKLILLLAMIIPMALSAQKTVNKEISKKTIGRVKCEFNMMITEGDTTQHVVIFFQNLKYAQIQDLKYIFLHSDEEVEALRSNINEAYKSMGAGEEATIKGDDYEFYIKKNFPAFLYAETSGVSGYTQLNKGQLIKLNDWLKTIKF